MVIFTCFVQYVQNNKPTLKCVTYDITVKVIIYGKHHKDFNLEVINMAEENSIHRNGIFFMYIFLYGESKRKRKKSFYHYEYILFNLAVSLIYFGCE